ncbi:IS3 family transposase [Pseudoxanthomonas sp. CF125]|uniref:IS3 family transposase n=1 Tax=Pseudoxanthomonas sp. CF125 TaxID=1855303 RepID=UPI00087E2826|nr:IS3 family transposase [Pseudoxanthomonas sp. CF125]SDR06642.1 putative transposase [Pseudoxanthomonas sp. CF125]
MLTREQVSRVLQAYKNGASRYQIAERCQLSYGTVCRVLRLRSYEAYLLPRNTDKRAKHTETLLRNRLRKVERLLKITVSVVRHLQPNGRKRALLATPVRARHGLSRQEANRIVGVSPSAGCPKLSSDATKCIVEDMTRYFDQNPGQGFNKVLEAILQGQPYGRKQLRQVYEDAKLQITNRRPIAEGLAPVPLRVSRPIQAQFSLNEMWSMDFMTHVTTGGKRFWILNIVDDFNRECVAAEVSERRSTVMVVRCLRKIRSIGRTPKAIRSDNGMEFKGRDYIAWAKAAVVNRVYIRPASPTENSLVERFNQTMRLEVLSRYAITSIPEAARMLEDWRVRYNLSRPHYSLGGLSPLQYSALAGSKASIKP